jgi:hypothetical protein
MGYIKLAACPITHVWYLKLLNKSLIKELIWDELINSLWPNWVLEFCQKKSSTWILIH